MRGALALLLVACASGPGPHRVSVGVNEVVTQRQPLRATGPHLFRVRVHNVGTTVIVVHTVRLRPANEGLTSDDSDQTVDLTVGPAVEQSFDVYMTITGNAFKPLDSVEVTLGCTDEAGKDFFDSGTYYIGREVSGG